MGFGELKSPPGLQVLNDHHVDEDYMEGSVPSPADVAVFEAVSGPRPADSCHALIVEDTTRSTATDIKDDDDVDLFGSDEEEESEEAKRLREERLAQYESKKSPQTLHLSPSLPSYYVRNRGMRRQIWQNPRSASGAFKRMARSGVPLN
ncbi:Hypothetical predicted protein [Marmota monax]|uniref:Elongation factor 1 beta central acidic region eukaryote domain-containing protein n=1 Tax=Marmota monax TaxID=9995 RepID=A0A5E4AVL2_MARMO|nr:Hypothetical predicted protein [Marmota monax]